MGKTNRDNLEYICKLMYEAYRIPIFYLNKSGKVIYEFSSNFKLNPMYSSKSNLLSQLFHSNPYNFPIIRSTSYLEDFISISVFDESGVNGTVILGPFVSSEPTEGMVRRLITDMKIKKDKQSEMNDYIYSLPLMSNMKAVYSGMHLYFLLYQEPLNPDDVIQKNKDLSNVIEIEDPGIHISQGRQNISLHHDEMHEQKLLQSIQQGKKDQAIKYFRAAPEVGNIGTLSKNNHLRHKKNLGIVIIALATRAAMKGGLHHEVAYTLSDLYIQNLEELRDITDVDSFMEDALGEFATRVQKKKQQNYSKPINICISHIFTNLYDDLNLINLAETANIHPNYLSTLFKKEVGITLREYMQQAKIEEAKTLITFTDYSLLKISTLLNFHDQSYFTKIFKKYTGLTPKQFKNKTEIKQG
jgi:YesN/AraC family two-component response regulator